MIFPMGSPTVAELSRGHTVIPGGREPVFYGLSCLCLDLTLVGFSIRGKHLSSH